MIEYKSERRTMEKRVVLRNEEIMKKVKEIAKYLDDKYANENPVVVGIMKGSLYFLSDLTKEMTIDLEIDVMNLSSYGLSATTSGVVRIVKDLDIDITNRNVIVLEDIVDTGTTLAYLKKYFLDKNAKSVETISIFQKENTQTHDVKADLIGFVLPDKFLVGYGLDYAQKYRSLKDVYEIIEF